MDTLRRFFPAVIGLFVLSFLSACSEPQAPATAAPAAKVVKKKLTIVGSNTVGETLGFELVKGYLQDKGYQIAIKPLNHEVKHVVGTKGNEELTVIIESRGSSSGFLAFQTGGTDIAMASRRIKDKEADKLKNILGDMKSPYAEHVIALDGLAIVVNPQNSVSSLTKQQIAEIYAGKIKNWSEVGGSDLPITVLTRDRLSGTLSMFKKLIMKPYGQKIPLGVKEFASSQEMSFEVLENPAAIGFVGTVSIKNDKPLGVADETNSAVLPTNKTIADGSYLLSRELYMYTPPKDAKQEATDFIQFARSPEGKKIVLRSGMVPPRS